MIDATKLDFAGYVMPTAPLIVRGRTTEKLYKLEEETMDVIRAGAEELATVLEIPEAMYWKQTLPEALVTILGSYDQEASINGRRGLSPHAGDCRRHEWSEEFPGAAMLIRNGRKIGHGGLDLGPADDVGYPKTPGLAAASARVMRALDQEERLRQKARARAKAQLKAMTRDAAEDLLLAAKELLLAEGTVEVPEAKAKLRAAIAKAEGTAT